MNKHLHIISPFFHNQTTWSVENYNCILRNGASFNFGIQIIHIKSYWSPYAVTSVENYHILIVINADSRQLAQHYSRVRPIRYSSQPLGIKLYTYTYYKKEEKLGENIKNLISFFKNKMKEFLSLMCKLDWSWAV